MSATPMAALKKPPAMAQLAEAAVAISPQALTQTSQEKLRQIVARIERLEEEKAGLAADIKDVYGEAKGFGYDTKVLRKVIRLRKQDARERAEQEQILDLYLLALGEI